MKPYTTLNDAVATGLTEFEPGRLEIWYDRKPTFLGDTIRFVDLEKTHIHLGTIKGRGPGVMTTEELERIFLIMQGEMWSPNGEAQNFILDKGLHHTSMSVGDVVKAGPHAWMIGLYDWKKLV